MPNRNARVIIPLAVAVPLVTFVLDRTGAPEAIYVAFGVGFAVAVPLVVFHLMAEAGWSTLARRFRQVAPFNGTWRRCSTAYMAPVSMDDPGYQGRKLGFISTLRVGTSAEALYLTMLFSKVPILGRFFPNVQIPWPAVRNARSFEAPGFFKANQASGALVQVNYDPNYTGTFVELEIGGPPVFLQLPVVVLGEAMVGGNKVRVYPDTPLCEIDVLTPVGTPREQELAERIALDEVFRKVLFPLVGATEE